MKTKTTKYFGRVRCMSFFFYPRKKKRHFLGGASFIYCWKRYALSGDQFRRCMVPSSLLFWSTLSSSRKMPLRVICPEYLGPATWLSKHSSALQGVLKATGQTGTEGTFATFAATTSSFLSLAKVPIVQGYKEGTGFALAVPALLLCTPAGGQ